MQLANDAKWCVDKGAYPNSEGAGQVMCCAVCLLHDTICCFFVIGINAM